MAISLTKCCHPRLVLPWGRLVHGCKCVVDEGLSDFLGADWPDQIMEMDVSDRFHAKQGRSIGRLVMRKEDGTSLTVYLKRHYVLPRLQGLFAVVRCGGGVSPAWQEWHHLATVRAMGIPVPRSVAVAEYLMPGGKLSSALAVEELTGMIPLHEAIPIASKLLKPQEFSLWKRRLIVELARLSSKLHRHNIFHKDLYLCHFYLREYQCSCLPSTFEGQVAMIDFHRLGQHSLLKGWYRIKDLGQLLFSATDLSMIQARDLLRFWREYRKQVWGTSTNRPLLQKAILWKWRLYQRHNRRSS